jgi:signal transduction histidine kinase
MKAAHRFLLLEDDTNDCELIRRTLVSEWPDCDLVCVHSGSAYQAALSQSRFDLILCDYCLPGFGGLEALAFAREHFPDVPVIFVSGGIGDEIAIESLKAGATDYVLKDRLARLVPAVRRALKERAERARRKRAEIRMLRFQDRLAQSNKDLLRRNQEIQSFYHTLSHELKTPLTAAREFISIVLDGLAGPLNLKQHEYLRVAHSSCEQLRLCIDDLLDATRLETGKLEVELQPASLGELAQNVLKTVERQALAKGIRLNLEVQPDLPDAPLNQHRMTQVITNLLNNAIKHTPRGGSILVKTNQTPGHPELIQLSVSDTGCGIPKEEQERIFDRLYQVKNGDAASEQGIGLGLYLCRELLRLHSGSIRVESEPAKGSTFTIFLPRSQKPVHPNLLLVDDDPELLEILRLVLTSEQYDVRTAGNGEEALREMRRQTADIIILDLSMPKLNGAATLREIRQRWGEVPVIVHTGFTDGELMKQALAYSPFTLLAKPSTTDQLLDTVHRLHRSADTTVWKQNHFDLPKPRHH